MAGVSLGERGWHLTDEGLEQCKQNGRTDTDSLIRAALDTDLREIGKGWLPEDINRGRADYVEGPGIVQLQKIRNVSAPKDNEESQAAPRIMKLTLTDGQTSCTAIETEVLKDIGLNTPPGSKVKLKSTIDIEHGFLLLNNKNTQFLGGRVEKLVEGWELKKKLAHQQRMTGGSEGGPPPFVPFGHKIDNTQLRNPRRDNFKSLEANKSEKEKKEDDEFEQQRKATIAEALQAKEDASARKFGGQKPVTSDHDIARITEMGFRADEAGTALRMHNGNVQHAIDHLLTRKKPGVTNRQSSYESDRGGDRGRGRRDRREDENGPGRGRRGRDGEETGEAVSSKPSGPATLFDFLETKFPANESKGSSKEGKSTSNQFSSSNKTTTENNTRQSTYNDYKDRSRPPQNMHQDTSQSQPNRPKQQQNLPPRFVNKSKQETGQNFNKGQGRYRDDRSDRQRDDRPRTAPSDRNYDNRNYNDRNFSDRNYGDRNYNERDRNKGYNDKRTNDFGDNRGSRDTRGERGQNYNRNASSDYSERSSSHSGSAKSDTSDKKGPRYNKENRENQQPQDVQKVTKVTVSNSQPQMNADTNGGNNKSQKFQKGQNTKTDQNSTPQPAANRQQNLSKGGDSQQPPQNYRNGRSQNSNQNFVANGNYRHQQQVNYGGGQPVSTAVPYQQQSEYVYTEQAQIVPYGVKVGDKVMAKYWEDGRFYEAVIDYVAPNLPTCMVVFLEYGNCEEVFLSDVRPFLPQMQMGQQSGAVLQPDMSVPPPGVFFSAPPLAMTTGLDETGQSINSMEFRRGGGGAAYQRKEGRPAQQLYQPPSQRR